MGEAAENNKNQGFQEKKEPTLSDYKELAGEYKNTLERLEALEKREADKEKALANAAGKNMESSQDHFVRKANNPLGLTNKQFRAGLSHDSDEQKCFRAYGVSDINKLVKVNIADPKFAYVDPQLAHMVIGLKRDIDIARGIAQIFYGDPMDTIGATEHLDRTRACKNLLESKFAKEVLVPKLKAFVTGTASAGGDWIPTIVADSFIPEFELQRRLIGELRAVSMPSSPYEQPTLTNQTTARRGTENVTATESNFNTEKITFTAQKFLEYYILSEEITEDTAPNILETARQELGRAHERAFETSVINGTDSALTHIDSDTDAGAADLAEKQYNGLRKLAIDNTANGGTVDFGNAVITDAKLREVRQNLGILGHDPTDLLWILGSVGWNQIQGTDNVVTLDKLGTRATVITGNLTSYAGIPIVSTGFMREDLNATGVEDGVTTDRTGLLLIHKRRWYFATRRAIRMAIRPARSADDRFEMASYSRVDFQGHPQTATELGVVYGVNIST